MFIYIPALHCFNYRSFIIMYSILISGRASPSSQLVFIMFLDIVAGLFFHVNFIVSVWLHRKVFLLRFFIMLRCPIEQGIF